MKSAALGMVLFALGFCLAWLLLRATGESQAVLPPPGERGESPRTRAGDDALARLEAIQDENARLSLELRRLEQGAVGGDLPAAAVRFYPIGGGSGRSKVVVRLLDQNQNPVPNARISILQVGRDVNYEDTFKTDAEGRVCLGNSRVGPIQIHIPLPGGFREFAGETLPGNCTDIAVLMPSQLVPLSGVVRHISTGLLSGANLSFSREGPGFRDRVEATTGPGGEYTVSGLPCGIWNVFIAHKDVPEVPWPRARVLIAAPGPLRHDFPVGIASVSGVISDVRTGEPISGATIGVNGAFSADALTDHKGQFCIYDLCPGDYLAEVSHTDYVRATQGVVVDGQSGKDFDFGLVRAAWLSVTVVDRQGQRLQTPMRFHLIEIGRSEGEGVWFSARCTPEGTFVLRRIAPGQYLLSAVADGAAGSCNVALQEGENRVEIVL